MNPKTSSRIASIQSDFLVPDYYPSFVCKGGDCRNTCCSGWGVTIPRDQYYTLLGLSCDQELREKLDRTFRPLTDATVDRYAEIIRTYEGKCPLHMENGYCLLHYHLGETVLPSVCRYYPRGPRTDFAMECACSNSCEKTLELLFTDESPIRFIPKKLIFQMPTRISERSIAAKEEYQRVRSLCFQILQNRAFSFPTRLLQMGRALVSMDCHEQVDIATLEASIPAISKDIPLTYATLFQIAKGFIEAETSLADLFQDSLRFYQDGSIQAKYDMLNRHFEAVLPNQAVFFEKMIINHLSFAEFPFREQAKSFYDEFVCVCGIYLVVRYLALFQMREKNRIEDIIDIIAKLFRVIAHTHFEQNILILLQREAATDFMTIAQMIQA